MKHGKKHNKRVALTYLVYCAEAEVKIKLNMKEAWKTPVHLLDWTEAPFQEETSAVTPKVSVITSAPDLESDV